MTEPQQRTFDSIVKLLGIAGVFTGFIIGLYQYKDAKQKEFYSTFWNRRLDVYAETSRAVAQLATADSFEEAAPFRGQFWQLYYGPMSLVEDTTVKAAMQKFAGKLEAAETKSENPSELKPDAYTLSLALRDSVRSTWDHPFEF